MPEEIGHFLKCRHPLFDQQAKGIQKTPQNEVPRRAMPEAGEHPHYQGVKQPSCFADPVAAQRNIHIVTEPGAQANMPAAPEFGNGLGKYMENERTWKL